ncbi:unnamed protein product [Hermetia illucens]|uniref:NADP-dependent oxidoreductase domain-containing protein n=1 Tax=Hermetia illucens TaxID=343691 RepID=A0A7R8YT40_HERIL|nr:aldo-keto reductase family 1 member B1-like [Hermetia illucens]CAD7084139.1 unnamed protein product [Hermetia illucens]
MSKVPQIKLNNGELMPGFGLGTYKSVGGDGRQAIKDAIDLGYRQFDTAFFYENEDEVGQAIKEKIAEGVIKREDAFVVTKLWSHFHDPDKVEHACRLSLGNLGLDYIDLYLMHWPYGYEYEGDKIMFPTNANGEIRLSNVDYLDTWKAMENLVSLGLVKSIGVSNFNEKQIDRLLSAAKIKPVCNQIEYHPGLQQTQLVQHCVNKGIAVTGYSPLGCPDPSRDVPNFITNANVKAIGAKYNKSSAQVILRYLVESNVVPIPKSSKKHRLLENISIFDFQLDEEDHKALAALNINQRVFPMSHASKSQYYPF